MKIKREIYKNDKLYLFLVCIASFFFHFYFSNYVKKISTYNDELLYTSIARSLNRHQSVLVYNTFYNFRKILYPLLIAPAYISHDLVQQEDIIACLNCLFLSLGSIPVYLLAKRFLKNCIYIFLVCILYLISSDWAYSLTFMSESLYLPMALMGIWLTVIVLDQTENLLICDNPLEVTDVMPQKQSVCTMRNKLRLFYKHILLGFYYWLMYLCKEIALVFPLSYAMILMLMILSKDLMHRELQFTHIVNKNTFKTSNQTKRIRKNRMHKVALAIGCVNGMIMGFAVPAALCGFYVFRAGTSSYSFSLENSLNNTAFSFLYAGYGTFYFLLITTIGFFLPTFLIAFWGQKNINRKGRYFLYYLCILLLISALTISYTITVHEDFGEIRPRVHLRYIGFLFAPFVIAAMQSIENWNKDRANIKSMSIFAGIILILYLYYLLIWGHRILGAGELVDHTMLRFLTVVDSSIYQLGVLLIYAIIVLLMCGMIYRNSKAAAYLYIGILLALSATNWLISVTNFKELNTLSTQDVNTIEYLQQFDLHHKNDCILVISENSYEPLIDTAMQESNLYEIKMKALYSYVKSRQQKGLSISWADASQNLSALRLPVKYPQFNDVDYIILTSNDLINFGSEVEKVKSLPDDISIYQILEHSKMPEMSFNIEYLSLENAESELMEPS